MLLHQLKVVFWKNLIIRKRHWFLTLIESILPVTLFFLIAYGRSKITGLNKEPVTLPTFNSIEAIRYDINVGDISLLYTPNNEFTNNITNKLFTKLQLPSSKSIAFNNQDELIQYYIRNTNYTTIAIIFDGSDKKHFNYKIRYHDQNSYDDFIITEKKYGNPYVFVPGEGSYKYRQIFIPIQMALDTSFIENSLNVDQIPLTISSLEFPYPPYNKDSFITSLFLDLLPVITLISFIFMCPAVLKRVVEEKHSGIKELMKMVGMKSWMLWLGWFIYGLIPVFVSSIFIVIFMKVPMFGSEYPLIEHSNGGILFVFILLYASASIALCFAISSFFNKPTIALITGILVWILSYTIPKVSLDLDGTNQLSFTSNILLNLLPNMALHYAYWNLAVFEEREIGVQWNNFYKSSSGSSDDVTFLNVYLMLIFDIFLYLIFTLYMDAVKPGKYGIKKPILYPIYNFFNYFKRFCSKSRSINISTEIDCLKIIEEGRGLEKGIEINNLHKRYGHTVAVCNLNMDIYKNQITVLLGHNGAGKSTTMSMITGMTEATSGSIRVNGLSVKNSMDEIRLSLGLCPQHNLLFPDLTVKEHLLFFAKLKGLSSSKADNEAEELLKKLNLEQKKDSMAQTLSGGMKRKLCLGMALVGGSKILILDEPSSGMDPESRRQLWDLLLKWRGEKTILITTHFMEEADALGDWIAIMSHGSLSCYGTPLYLKKKYGTGYHLSIMFNCNSEDRDVVQKNIESEIIKEVPEVSLKSKDGNNLVFLFPFESKTYMPKVLKKLEAKKESLQIENISVAVTTLEDVFIKTHANSTDDTDSNLLEDTQALLDIKPTDIKKDFTLTVKTLLTKKFNFSGRKKRAYVIPILVALALFILAGFLGNSNDFYTDDKPELKLKLSTYRQTSVYYNGTKDNPRIRDVMDFYNKITRKEGSLPFEVNDVQEGILKKASENIAYYKEHMIAGATFTSENEAIALYNAIALHSLPISVNLITNSLAKALLGADYSISSSNWPLPSVKDDFTRQKLSEAKITIIWLLIVPIGCLFILGEFILFPCMEISTKFLRLQYMCGVRPIMYWIVNFLSDFLVYACFMFIMTLIIWGISPLFNNIYDFGYLYLIFILYGVAGIPFSYLFSRKNTVSGAFSLLIITSLFLGIILTVIIGVLIEFDDSYYKPIGEGLRKFCFIFIPQVGLTDALVNFSRRAVNIYNLKVTPTRMAARCFGREDFACCVETSEKCINFKHYTGMFNDHFLMFLSLLFYMCLNILLDTYYWLKIKSHFLHFCNTLKRKILFPNRKDSKNNRSNINVNSTLQNNEGEKFGTLKAQNMSKSYSGQKVVNHINLTLDKGQCLGILGVNGAGKTTTFRLLTREEVLDEGQIDLKINDKHYNVNNSNYQEVIGYCPQADFLNFVLTGREILTTIAYLRGITANTDKLVDDFINIFELEKCADIPCGHYSGGNKRKLSLAISLIGYPEIVLLDEPTNGVDPASRRKCWTLLKKLQHNKSLPLSFILTSHSMVECEALCNELQIMKEGEIVKGGKLSDLKKDYSGFSLKLKIKSESKKNVDVDEIDGGCCSSQKFRDVNDVKTYFMKNDRGELKDEHDGLLHFYIKDNNKKWSEIFEEVNELKAQNPDLIEDYVISEASIEDVFLQVARSEKV